MKEGKGNEGTSVHHYPHHIGDFVRDTARLSDRHSMAYLRMIWLYYESESPLPDRPDILALKLGVDPSEVSLLLDAYFSMGEDGLWHHARCDREIEAYRSKAEAAARAGRASAERRNKGRSTPVQQAFENGVEAGSKTGVEATDVQRLLNAGSTPVEHPLNDRATSCQPTNNQEPIKKNPPTPRDRGEGFDEFWSAYPRKVAKAEAIKAWAKIAPDADLRAKILASLDAAKRSPGWRKDNGQFIPHPTTWLNQRRWEDEENSEPKSTQEWIEQFDPKPEFDWSSLDGVKTL